MSISFDGIPDDLRIPLCFVEFDNSQAVKGTPTTEYKVLALGQMLSTGKAEPLVPVLVTSADQATDLFGQGSMLDHMFGYLTKANSALLEVWAIPLEDDAAGVAAAGAVTIGGLATRAGVLNLYVAGTRVRIAVASGAAPATVATALAAAITAKTALPVTAAVDATDTAKVVITCRWKGATGNDLDLRLNYYAGEELPAGLTATITAMTNGAANPDVADAIAAFGDEWWRAIIMPYTDTANLDALQTEMEDRWGPLRQKDGQVWCAYRGTLAASGTFGNTRNHQLFSCMGTNAAPEPPYVWAAVYAAKAAGRLKTDPARPLTGMVLTGLKPPAVGVRWIDSERNILLWDGIATFTVSAAGECCIEHEITMYRKNSFGLDDPSYLDVQTPATLGYRRYATRARITQKWPDYKLANDGTVYGEGQAIVTPSVIRDELLVLFKELILKGLVEDYDSYKDTLVVERNADNQNRVDVLEKPDLVNQLRMVAILTQFKV